MTCTLQSISVHLLQANTRSLDKAPLVRLGLDKETELSRIPSQCQSPQTDDATAVQQVACSQECEKLSLQAEVTREAETTAMGIKVDSSS